jgi:hypothetical protein
MSRPLAGGLWISLLLMLAAVLTPVVSAASADQAPASITDATTGLSDAASVAPANACGAPSAYTATCLAQVLRVRRSAALVHPRLRRPASPNRVQRPRARGSHVATTAIAAVGAPQPGTPAYLQEAYDLAYLSQTEGTDQTIAIVDAFDDPNAESDLGTYRTEFGLPPCTTANGCFTKLDESGGTNYPTTVDPGWELEISLDLDAVSALCPNCHIDLVEANSAGWADLANAEATAAGEPGVGVISNSWNVALDARQGFQFMHSGHYTFSGITTVAASGDLGYPGASTNDFPAALPGVVAAGGTSLEPASSNGVASVRGFTESAWSGAGSGCDTALTQPTWQTGPCQGRAYADMSADADPNTGMQVYDSDDNGWVVVGGTSEATPLIASYYALLDSAAQATNPLLASAPEGPEWAYDNASLLNDPTTGSNGTCAASIAYICDAGTGYDGPTGAGTISGGVADGAPGVAGPGTTGTYAPSISAQSAELQGGVYPNGEDTTYYWEYGTTTDYGETTPATDIGSGTAPVQVTDTLPDLSAGMTYHYRLVAANSLGTSYGYDYALTTPATVATSPTQGTGGTGTQSPPTTTSGNPPATGTGGSGGSSGPAGAPFVTTPKAAPAAGTATVSATITGRGGATTYALQYGTTAAFGRSATGSLASSQATANRSWTLHNLAPDKIYYMRVVASNTAGTTASATVRFRTSPVTITTVSTSTGKLQVVLRCHGSAPCRFRLQGRYGNRVMLSSQGSIRGNRSTTITLPLTRTFRTLAVHSRSAKLLVLSTWNGVTATVSRPI